MKTVFLMRTFAADKMVFDICDNCECRYN